MSMEKLAQSPACDEETAICPYMGLASFKLENAKYFFGRDKDARKIVDHITNLTLTVLVGASGAGKSSILNAAVPKALADIRKGTLIVPFAQWYPGFYAKLCADVSRIVLTKLHSVHPERSGAHPGTVQDGQPRSPSSSPADPRSQSLERSSTQWVKIARTPVFFVFDQFEQYFINRRASVQTNIDAGFEKDLAHLVNGRDLQAHVLISIREDALFELNQLRARIPNILDPLLKLDHLDHAAAREAIEGPLRKWRDEHEACAGPACAGPTSAAPELIDELIRQVSRTTDSARIEAPYLQLALKRLWEQERREGSSELRLETLKALGYAKGIAKVHFENTMKALPEDEQRLCATIFDRMVTPSGMKIALSARDLARLANRDSERVRSVLEELANGPSRIINCVRSPKDNQTILYEIFHDVLARPIRDWIAAERERVEQQEKLEKQKREAEQERARQQERLEEHKREAEKERALKGRYRKLAIAAGLGFLLASVFAGVATYTYRDAATQKSHLLAAKAGIALDDGDGRTGLLLALEALPGHPGWLDWINYPDRESALHVLDRALWMPLGLALASPGGRITLAAFGPDGRDTITASDTGNVQLWRDKDVARLRLGPPQTLKHDRAFAAVNSAGFDEAGEVLVTTLANGHAYIWDAKTGETYTEWEVNSWRSQTFASISPDAKLIATASYNDKVPQFWHWDQRDPRKEPVKEAKSWPDGASHENGITSLAFDKSGERLVTTSWDRTARVWQVSDSELLQQVCHDGAVVSARFSPDGTRLVTASMDGTARVWALTGKSNVDWWGSGKTCESFLKAKTLNGLKFTLLHGEAAVTSADFDRTGRQIVTASRDGAARIWDARTGELLRLLQGPNDMAGRATAALSPDGRTLVAAFSQPQAYLWTLNPEGEQRRVSSIPARLVGISSSASGDRVAIASDDTAVKVYDTSKGRLLRDVPIDQPPLAVAMSPAGAFIAVATGSTVGIWTAEGENPPLRLLPHGSLVLSVAYDPVGKWLISSTQDGTVRLWPTVTLGRNESPEILFAPAPGEDGRKRQPVFAAMFSKDGRFVYAGSFDGRIRVADAETGKELPERELSVGRPIMGLALTQDGRYLVASTLLDGSVAPTGTEIEPASRHGTEIVDTTTHKSVSRDSPADPRYFLEPRYLEPLQNGNALLLSVEGESAIAASVQRMVRLGRLPPEDAYEQIAYAREARLGMLPEPLRSFNDEERKKHGLTDEGALHLSQGKAWLNIGIAWLQVMQSARGSSGGDQVAGQ